MKKSEYIHKENHGRKDNMHIAEPGGYREAITGNSTVEAARKVWLSDARYAFKHSENAAQTILTQMKEQADKIKVKKKISDVVKDKLDAAITYFTNQLSRINYFEYTAKNLPIGSGVIEAACKTLIKQRLCHSGMR